jgi:hypothetical protein
MPPVQVRGGRTAKAPTASLPGEAKNFLLVHVNEINLLVRKLT